MNTTTEGWLYNVAEDKLTAGHATPAAVSPLEWKASTDQSYDAIVIGAGFAGLVCARNLSLQGWHVLVVEARDRIGGRAWTSLHGAEPWEMGGTWIHWGQPHVYAEISRYGLAGELQDCMDFSEIPGGGGRNCATFCFDGERRDVTYEEQDRILEKVYKIFTEFDEDAEGSSCMPFPHKPDYASPKLRDLDHLSVEERLHQVNTRLSSEERACLNAFISSNTGASNEQSGLVEILRWWKLCGQSAQSFMAYLVGYKLKCGQSGFARKIFDHALSSGNLAYLFRSPVQSVQQDGSSVLVSTHPQRTFRARYVVSTIPLNVLTNIRFQPPLPPAKQRPLARGHVDRMVKIHAEVTGAEWGSWSAAAWPSSGFTTVFGDGLTRSHNAHLVGFAPSAQIDPVTNPKDALAAFRRFNRDFDVKNLIFHDWNSDPYARGAWCIYGPGFASEHLDALQKPQGRVHFCSADWADGWRGFIDGAIEQANRVSHVLAGLLVAEKGGGRWARIPAESL